MTRIQKTIRSLREVSMSPPAILNFLEALEAGLLDPAGAPGEQELIAILRQNDAYPPRQAEALAAVIVGCRPGGKYHRIDQ